MTKMRLEITTVIEIDIPTVAGVSPVDLKAAAALVADDYSDGRYPLCVEFMSEGAEKLTRKATRIALSTRSRLIHEDPENWKGRNTWVGDMGKRTLVRVDLELTRVSAKEVIDEAT